MISVSMVATTSILLDMSLRRLSDMKMMFLHILKYNTLRRLEILSFYWMINLEHIMLICWNIFLTMEELQECVRSSCNPSCSLDMKPMGSRRDALQAQAYSSAQTIPQLKRSVLEEKDEIISVPP
ncbi:hypothetical protein TNCV_2703541 [Trichonephila clavipes]|nr:hypothetical protein TNCV_2703541 [Trichonephila clavipes]